MEMVTYLESMCLASTVDSKVLEQEMFSVDKSTLRAHLDAILGNLHCRRTSGYLKCSHCTDDC